jgi:hypothetical protein
MIGVNIAAPEIIVLLLIFSLFGDFVVGFALAVRTFWSAFGGA